MTRHFNLKPHYMSNNCLFACWVNPNLSSFYLTMPGFFSAYHCQKKLIFLTLMKHMVLLMKDQLRELKLTVTISGTKRKRHHSVQESSTFSGNNNDSQGQGQYLEQSPLQTGKTSRLANNTFYDFEVAFLETFFHSHWWLFFVIIVSGVVLDGSINRSLSDPNDQRPVDSEGEGQSSGAR